MSFLDDIGSGILGGGERKLEGDTWEKVTAILDAGGTNNDWISAVRGADTKASGLFKALAPLGLYQGLDQLVNGATWEDKVGGGLDTASSGAGLLELMGIEAAGPVGAVIAAGATGWATGTKGNELQRKRGTFGEKEDGEHRNLSDAWGDVAFNPVTSQQAGPALLGMGGLAIANVMAEPYLEMFGVDAPMSTMQQNQMNAQSSSSFATLQKNGMSEAAAERVAGIANPQFAENRERLRNYDALVKSGLPLSVANSLTGVTR